MFKKNAGRTTRQQSFRAHNQTFPNSAIVKGFAMSSLETTLNNWRNPASPRDNTWKSLELILSMVMVGAYGGPVAPTKFPILSQ